MRIELTAVKATIEVAMYNEVDQDVTVPLGVVNALATLHAALVDHEKE